MEPDGVDIKILNTMIELRETRYATIAKRLGVTAAAVQKRVKKMMRGGIFLGTMPLLDLKKIGFGITALIKVSITKGKLVELAEEWALKRNVCAVYRITGDYDMLIVGKFKTMDELNEFTLKLHKEGWVSKTNTSLTLATPREAVNPNEIY